MKREFLSFFVLILVGVATALAVLLVQAKRDLLSKAPQTQTVAVQPSPTDFPLPAERSYTSTISLPEPKTSGGVALNTAIETRRSRRTFSEEPVTLAEISQMLWSGQGITDPATGKRTAPSARESYSMTIFLVVQKAEGLEPGVYEYLPKTNSLGLVTSLDTATALKDAGVQDGAVQAPVSFLISSAFGTYQQKTKSTSTTATYMEAGHIGQNMYLTAESLGMSTVTMAGFDNTKVVTALKLDPAETVEYVMPFGHRAPEVEEAK